MSEAISTPQRFIPPPHPRILAQDQPIELQEKFARVYPNGIPREYNMCRPTAHEIPVKYIEDNLPLGFYTNPPAGAKAIFSTGSGQRDFRYMHHILPRRRLHLWPKTEIQQNCNSIRKTHWSAMRGMTQPLCWDDLWHYFDAFDLYHQGAINLWNIINHLYAENRIVYADMMKTCALELGRWADQWLVVKSNAEKLKSWEASKGPVIQILDFQDWNSLGSLNDEEIPMLANALKCRRDHLLSRASIESADARDLQSSCRNEGGLENWMTGQKVHPRNGLPNHEIGEAVSGGKNFRAPCVLVDGKHYYDSKTRLRGAVEALKESVEAASSPVVVVNGSRMSPPKYVSTDVKKIAANAQKTRPSSSDGSNIITPRSGSTSQSGSPRRMSDSTVRPSHLPSPKVAFGPVVLPGNAATANNSAAQIYGQSPQPVPVQV